MYAYWTMLRVQIILLLLSLGFILPLSAVKSSHGPPAQGLLLVVNKGEQTLGIVSPGSDAQLAAVPEGGITGHEVAASPDGRTAYVPIYGNSGVGRPGTDGRNMVVIDIAGRKVIGNVDFGHGVRPHCAVFEPNKGLLYVTTELDNSITIVDPHTLKIVGSIPTNQPESHMLAITRDGQAWLHRQCRTRHSLGSGPHSAKDDFRHIRGAEDPASLAFA